MSTLANQKLHQDRRPPLCRNSNIQQSTNFGSSHFLSSSSIETTPTKTSSSVSFSAKNPATQNHHHTIANSQSQSDSIKNVDLTGKAGDDICDNEDDNSDTAKLGEQSAATENEDKTSNFVIDFAEKQMVGGGAVSAFSGGDCGTRVMSDNVSISGQNAQSLTSSSSVSDRNQTSSLIITDLKNFHKRSIKSLKAHKSMAPHESMYSKSSEIHTPNILDEIDKEVSKIEAQSAAISSKEKRKAAFNFPSLFNSKISSNSSRKITKKTSVDS